MPFPSCNGQIGEPQEVRCDVWFLSETGIWSTVPSEGRNFYPGLRLGLDGTPGILDRV